MRGPSPCLLVGGCRGVPTRPASTGRWVRRRRWVSAWAAICLQGRRTFLRQWVAVCARGCPALRGARGAVVHTLPVLGCPNPTEHIPGDDIHHPPTEDEAGLWLPELSPAWGVSSSPPCPRAHGCAQGEMGDVSPPTPVGEKRCPPPSTSAPPPQTTPTFPKQQRAEGRAALSPAGGKGGGQAEYHQPSGCWGEPVQTPQTWGAAGPPVPSPGLGCSPGPGVPPS